MKAILFRLSKAIQAIKGKRIRTRLKRQSGLIISDSVAIHASPIIQISEGASIIISDHVTLNSDNSGYHLNMFGPVKLLADRPKAKIFIGSETRIHGSCVHAWNSITIGSRCLIAANCQIIDSNGHPNSAENVSDRVRLQDEAKPVEIQDDVWIGAGTTVLPGVTIGYGSIIGASSVVTKSIPPMTLAGGNPARVIKTLH